MINSQNIIWKKPDGSVAITMISMPEITIIPAWQEIIPAKLEVHPSLVKKDWDGNDIELESEQPMVIEEEKVIDHPEEVITKKIDSAQHAKELQDAGVIPLNWQAVAIDAQAPDGDDDFFDAMIWESGSITHDIKRAREITKNRLRIERAPLLQAADIAFMRAIESGNEAAKDTATNEKQRLRDITNSADECKALDELRKLMVR